jgi:hypothetical protein
MEQLFNAVTRPFRVLADRTLCDLSLRDQWTIARFVDLASSGRMDEEQAYRRATEIITRRHERCKQCK